MEYGLWTKPSLSMPCAAKCFPLYVYTPGIRPCLSLGRAQPFTDVDTDRLKSRGWEVVRRMTGGRAILHTDELTYSVTGRIDEPNLAGSLLESYNRLAGALLAAVRDLGLSVEMKEDKAESGKIPNPVCFEVPSTYEITVNGKKLIGSAQARRKEGVLQHGSLPLTGDLTRICQALVFPDEAARAAAIGTPAGAGDDRRVRSGPGGGLGNRRAGLRPGVRSAVGVAARSRGIIRVRTGARGRTGPREIRESFLDGKDLAR